MERVWQKIDVRAPDECWPWTAKRKAEGKYPTGADHHMVKRKAHVS